MHEKHPGPAVSEPEEKKAGAVRGHGITIGFEEKKGYGFKS